MFSSRIRRTALLGATLTLAAGCERFNPEARDNRAYVRVMIPIMQDNALLSERVLIQAAALFNKKSEPEALVKAWTTEITPLAEHLHSQAAFTAPPESWADHHGKLVDIWGDRAHAYRALADAIATADDSQWQSSRDLADGVKLAEEKWFESANKRLAETGLAIDQFP